MYMHESCTCTCMYLFLQGVCEVGNDMVFPAYGLLVRGQQLFVLFQLFLRFLEFITVPCVCAWMSVCVCVRE